MEKINKDILEKVLKLSSKKKMILMETISRTIDKPDKEIDDIWIEEARKRLEAHRTGESEGIPAEEVLKCQPISGWYKLHNS